MTENHTKYRAVPLLVLLFLILALSSACAQETPDTADDNAALIAAAQAQLQANIQQGRMMQALYQLDVIANQTGWNPVLLEQSGDLWRQAGNVTQSLAYYALAADQSADVSLLRKLAQIYLDMTFWQQAVDTLSQIILAAPDDAWGNYQLGLIRAASDPRSATAYLLKAGQDARYETVSRAVLDVIADEAPSASLSLQVGITLAESELWSYAELAFMHSVQLDDGYAEAWAYLGLARDRQSKNGAVYIDRAVSLQPENPLVRYLQGLHLRSQVDYAGSLDALILATAYDPQNPAFYAELSNAYRLMNDLPNAERWLKVAVNLSGDDERFQRMLALFYSEEAYNLEIDGLSTLESATVQLPNDPELRAGFGWALYTMGEATAGLEQLNRALTIAPNNPRALYYKARILLDDDKTAEARPLLEQVAEQESPYQLEAQRLLDDISG